MAACAARARDDPCIVQSSFEKVQRRVDGGRVGGGLVLLSRRDVLEGVREQLAHRRVSELVILLLRLLGLIVRLLLTALSFFLTDQDVLHVTRAQPDVDQLARIDVHHLLGLQGGRELIRLGDWSGGARSFPVPVAPAGLRTAFLVQAGPGGPILAAAKG